MPRKGKNADNKNTVAKDEVMDSFEKAMNIADEKRNREFDGAKVNADLTKSHIDRDKFSKENDAENLPGNVHRAKNIDNTKTSSLSKHTKLRNKVQGAFFAACAVGTISQIKFDKSMKSLNRKLKNTREQMERYSGQVWKDVSYYMAQLKAKAIERKKEMKSSIKEKRDAILRLVTQSYNDFQRAMQLQTIQDMPSSADIRGRSMAVVTGDVVPSGELYSPQADKKDEPSADQNGPMPAL